MKYYIGSEQHFEDSVNGYYDRKEEEAKQFDNREQFPEPPSDNTQSIDMTAKDFFNGKGGALTLDFLHPTERDFLIDMIELYASGKVKNALKDNTQSIDTELAGKIWDAAELHKSQLLLSAYPPPSPDKETFINSLNLDNTQIRDSGYSLEDMEKELKEIDKYLDDLCLQTSKDSGNLWIQFSDKFQAFKKKLLTPYPQTKFSRSDCEKKLLLIFRDDVLPHRIKQLVDLCENIYNSKK